MSKLLELILFFRRVPARVPLAILVILYYSLCKGVELRSWKSTKPFPLSFPCPFPLPVFSYLLSSTFTWAVQNSVRGCRPETRNLSFPAYLPFIPVLLILLLLPGFKAVHAVDLDGGKVGAARIRLWKRLGKKIHILHNFLSCFKFGTNFMEISLGNHPFDLDFHPFSSIVAAGLIDGHLQLYRYEDDSPPQRLLAIHAHDESCRAVRFINSGHSILTASPDCSILATDVETGKTIARLEDAHEAAVNRLINLTETTIASGDDDGCIKVWDTRKNVCCNSFNAHEDYISDMTFVPNSNLLLGTSGDGTLSVCSLRKNKVQTQSEFSEDELLSVVVMKNGQKVICGTPTGALLLYSWGYFKDCSDRFPGRLVSVDALLKLDEDTLISGSEDGVIRLVGILPNRIIQPIAEHSEYPVERLAFSHERKFLGSISHDQTLKLWNLNEILGDWHKAPKQQAVAADSDDDEMDVDIKAPKAPKGLKKNKKNSDVPMANFFADL